MHLKQIDKSKSLKKEVKKMPFEKDLFDLTELRS